jgi:hypothetical protein
MKKPPERSVLRARKRRRSQRLFNRCVMIRLTPGSANDRFLQLIERVVIILGTANLSVSETFP